MKWLTWSCPFRSGHRRAGQQRGWLGRGDHWVFYQRRNHSTRRSVVHYAGEIVSNWIANVGCHPPSGSWLNCSSVFSPSVLVWKEEGGASSLIRGQRPRCESFDSQSSSKHALRIDSSNKHRLPHLLFLLNLIYRKTAFNNKENW